MHTGPSESILDRIPLRGLVGPTGSGKSGAAVRVATRMGERARPLEIVALDSMTVYRGLDVGTAKPSLEERGGIRHHLIDVADPRERFDLQSYLGLVEAAVVDMESRGAEPLFVGGTGLYLAAILRGLFEGPATDLELRQRLEAEAADGGLAAMRERLQRHDPQSHGRIHPGDARRTIRALEIFEQTGRPLSEHQQQWAAQRGEGPGPREKAARVAGLQLPTDVLDARIRRRTRSMLDAGWPHEALELERAEALGPSAVQALGYATAASLGRGELDLEEAVDEIALRTRQFARRQRTWFRKFEISWVDPRADDLVEQLCSILDEPRSGES